MRDAGCGNVSAGDGVLVVRWNGVMCGVLMGRAGVGAGRVGDGAGVRAETAHAGAPGDPAAALQPAHRGGVRRVGAAVRAVLRHAPSTRAGASRGDAVLVESGSGSPGECLDAESSARGARVLVPRRARCPGWVAGGVGAGEAAAAGADRTNEGRSAAGSAALAGPGSGG